MGEICLRVITRTKKGSTYRFVKISHRGKQKKIALHRLVWMSVNLEIVPDGFDVDHVNGRSDAYSNLRLLDMRTNRSRVGVPF